MRDFRVRCNIFMRELFLSLDILQWRGIQLDFIFFKVLLWKGSNLVFQNSHADFPLVTLHFCNHASVVELIDGYEVKIVLSTLVPPVANTGVFATLHNLCLKPSLEGAASKLFVVFRDILLEQCSLSWLNQILMRIDEPKPEAQVTVVNAPSYVPLIYGQFTAIIRSFLNANYRDCVADEHLCKYAMSELIIRDCETDEHQRKYEMSE